MANQAVESGSGKTRLANIMSTGSSTTMVTIDANDLSEVGYFIQQKLQEGNAVESNLSLIKERVLLDHTPEANAFYNINNDEAYHVIIGNKWTSYLVETNDIQEELLQLMLCAADKIDIPLFGKGGPSIRF